MTVNPFGIRLDDPPRPAAPNSNHAAVTVTPKMWHCANTHCDAAAKTYDAKIPYHHCPRMRGMMIPLVPVGTSAVHRPVVRPDYVGAELVQHVTDENGALVMAVDTETDHGRSTTVYAPTARAEKHDG